MRPWRSCFTLKSGMVGNEFRKIMKLDLKKNREKKLRQEGIEPPAVLYNLRSTGMEGCMEENNVTTTPLMPLIR